MTIGTSLYTLFKGTHVGTDEFGNRYYLERFVCGGRKPKRWVMYKGLAEPSKVPSYWHGWLHYTTDALPNREAAHRYDLQKEHLPNLTGTAGRYVPPGSILRGGKRDAATADYEAWKPN